MHVAKEKREKLDLKSRPYIFLGYNDDEFSYWVWDLVDKKVFRSRDIVFMEERTIADWESEKKVMNSGSSNENRLEDTRTYPVENRMWSTRLRKTR